MQVPRYGRDSKLAPQTRIQRANGWALCWPKSARKCQRSDFMNHDEQKFLNDLERLEAEIRKNLAGLGYGF